jgi:chromosome partitioning protein
VSSWYEVGPGHAAGFYSVELPTLATKGEIPSAQRCVAANKQLGKRARTGRAQHHPGGKPVKTITCAGAKGGGGKTTLAAGLACAAINDSPTIRVALMDLDPQRSLTLWWIRRPLEFPELFELGDLTLPAAQVGLRDSGVDLLILDCPPGFTAIGRTAIAASDLMLVPVQASALDLAALVSTTAVAVRAGVPHRVILNHAVFRSRLAGQAVRDLAERGGLLWPTLHQRVAIPTAMAAGRTALETEPAGAAARETVALWHTVQAVLAELPFRRRI